MVVVVVVVVVVGAVVVGLTIVQMSWIFDTTSSTGSR